MSEKFWYRVILEEDAEDVTRNMRERAQKMVCFVSAELAISSPRVIWISLAPISQETKNELMTEWRNACKLQPASGMCPLVRCADRRFREGQGFTPADDALYEIWLPGGLAKSPELEWVAAHETRHCWQKKERRRDIFDHICSAEGDAYPYAYGVLRRYLAKNNLLSDELREEIKVTEDRAREVFLNDCPNGLFKIRR